MSLLLFVQDRIRRQRMEPVALSRVNRLVRGFDTEGRLLRCAPASALRVASPDAKLTTRLIRFGDATSMVNMYHRHLAGPVGHLFSIGCFAEGTLVAVAIAGRPVAKHLDNGLTIEITRLASNGHRNACSKLYAAVRREAFSRGFLHVITYTRADEPGSSLRAAGYEVDGHTAGGRWSRRRRPRTDRHNLGPKIRWRSSAPSQRDAHGRAKLPCPLRLGPRSDR